MQPTLLVLAAGMGSRYGGLKQLDAMGPNGETILDYSIRDAQRAGFQKVVFVIRRDFEKDFRTLVGDPFKDQIEIAYAFQDLTDIPKPFEVPAGREKPWGTTHAVLAARQALSDPFAVINADDYYGADGYLRAMEVLQTMNSDTLSGAMVGYPIKNTLSPNGTVNRGVCQLEGKHLKSIEEVTGIQADVSGLITGINLAGEKITIPADTLVSMNLWVFSTPFLKAAEAYFQQFLAEHGKELKSECYLPSLVDYLISGDQMECPVLPTSGQWFGVTYPEDRDAVCRQLAALEK